MMKNLDAAINKASFSLAGKIEKEIEKAMGILANDGVYAFVIFCEYKGIWETFKKSINELDSLFPKSLQGFDKSKLESDDYILSDLLFVKEILEKMLTYTRYHLKAKGDGNG
ncbi:MAG: hypothetical protein PHR06_04065 [Candidatus Cloacimonetes bacterium]|nr:hypothetical protein [Candidatus Cloacimonadota bacterium]